MNQNTNEVKEAIRNIINESLNTRSNYDGTSLFVITPFINKLVAGSRTNPQLANYLSQFQNRISRGGREWLMFEQFGAGLQQFARGNRAVKEVINEMNTVLGEHTMELEGFKTIEEVRDDYVRTQLTECFNEYLAEPCDETKTNILEAIDNLYGVNEAQAMRMTMIVSDTANLQPEYFSTSVNESQEVITSRKLEENRKEKMANDIFAKVQRYLDEREEAQKNAENAVNETYSLKGIANNNGLNLCESIKNVLKSDAGKNIALRNILTQYQTAILDGAYEERLYETLLQNTAKYTYLSSVDKMRKAILEKVEERGEQITLTKLLEMMSENYNSYMIVDLIQEDVARYVHNPCPQNRVQLRNALMPWANDPYVTEMFRIIYTDDSIQSNSISEKALSIKEQIDLVKQDTTVSNIYTPVQYIRENESIFNVNGQYYVKKGSSIAALDKKYVSKLDERFVELTRLVNDPRVNILEDRIILTTNDKTATIYEGFVEIDGFHESQQSLRNLNEMCMKYDNYDTNFYIMCSCLLENFNNIAKIDWAKHISLNSNPAITADLFKLDENIFMAIHDNSLQKHTFYRNVNPLFCKNTLNEHMGINVSSLFSDMLPDQDKIILRLNETKNEYESSIDEYEKMIDDLNDALEDAKTTELKQQIKDTIADTKKKLEDVKSEYKEWQETTEEMITDSNNAEDDAEEQTVTKETSSEPLDADEVDDMRNELSTPLTGEENNEGESEAAAIADELSDDEFSTYLAKDATGETQNPDEEDDVIDTDVIDNAADVDDEFDFEDEDENPKEDDVEDEEEFKQIDVDDEAGAETEDDDIFDLSGEESDEISDEVPAEEVSDDEDILIDEPEIPETTDMTTVDAETGEEVGDEATDIFGGNTENPLEDIESSVNNTELYNPGIGSDDYNIVNVMFDANVQTDTVYKAGEVMAVCPMVDVDGNKYSKEIKVRFYLNADNTPVIQTSDDITNALYNAIKRAITSHPQFNDVVERGVDLTNVGAESTPVENGSKAVDDTVDIDVPGSDDWESEYKNDGTDEDNDIYKVGDDILDFNTDDIPEEIDTDNYDVFDFGDTEDTTPAVDTQDEPTFDFDDIMGDFGDDVIDASQTEVPATTDPVDTYTDVDGTEIEVPAPDTESDEDEDEELELSDVDGDEDSDVIPENFQRKVTRKQMNENRKAILSIRKK